MGNVRAFATLPDGNTTPLTEFVPSKALPYVLDAQRFAKMELSDRRSFLFGLMGLSASANEVKKRLLAKGCNEQKIDYVITLLRSGFDAANKEAQAKARDEKAGWRVITGETYGEKKAATWQAEKGEFDATKLAELIAEQAKIDVEIGAANQRLGAMQADYKRYTEAQNRLAGLREKSARHDRIAEKLARDEAELKEWEIKVSETKAKATSASVEHALTCPHCAGLVVHRNNGLHVYQEQATDADAAAKLPEYEKALHLLQSSVANDKRDLADAEAAGKTLAELTEAAGEAPSEDDIQSARNALDDLKAQRTGIANKIAELQNAERQVKQADEKSVAAMKHHQNVGEWVQIADALSPDGIQAEMLAEALEPINDRLEQSAADTEWLHVNIQPSMTIYAAYQNEVPRAYEMLSESEKWRADAMIAEAVSYLSKTKLLVLDRFDVLDMAGRSDLIAWLDILAQDNEIETALIFGTLKALPASLPETINAHWLENGFVSQLKEAA